MNSFSRHFAGLLFAIFMTSIVGHGCKKSTNEPESSAKVPYNLEKNTVQRDFKIFYGNFTKKKLNELAARDKLLFSEAETEVLREENIALSIKEHFEIISSKDSVWVLDSDPDLRKFGKENPFGINISVEKGFIQIEFDIIGEENWFWIGKVFRKNNGLELFLSPLDGFSAGFYVRQHGIFKVNLLGEKYPLISLNGIILYRKI